jgi:hypothetical protein
MYRPIGNTKYQGYMIRKRKINRKDTTPRTMGKSISTQYKNQQTGINDIIEEWLRSPILSAKMKEKI